MTYNVALNPPNQFAISAECTIQITVAFFSPSAQAPSARSAQLPAFRRHFPKPRCALSIPNIKPSYTEFYDLAVEHQLNSSVLSRCSVPRRTRHPRLLHRQLQPRVLRPYVRERCGSRMLHLVPARTPTVSTISTQLSTCASADADSYYNAVNVSARGSTIFITRHLTLTTNYTFAHATDNLTSTFASDGGSNGTLGAGGVAYFDPYNTATRPRQCATPMSSTALPSALIYETPVLRHQWIRQAGCGCRLGVRLAVQCADGAAVLHV